MSNVTLELPTLFKRSNGGATQRWDISVEKTEEGHGIIVTRYGQVDGAIQEARDPVRKGKNIGKKNETTALQQAEIEARAKWKKQIENKGYVEDIDRAIDGETDIEIGISPMLAMQMEKALKKLLFSCDMQRKYNGVRCLVEINDGKATLTTRKRKLITSMPHIVKAYEDAFKNYKGRIAFDGEIYRHGWSLQKISGYVRSSTPKEGHEQLGHFVYDAPLHKGKWPERRAWLEGLKPWLDNGCLHLVETISVSSLEEAKAKQKEWVLEGYEGGILRILIGVYEAGKRSYYLIKVKDFQEREFKIIRVTEGERGKFQDCAVFWCVTDSECPQGAGLEFSCAAPGTLEDKAEYLANSDKLVGKDLTVKFFEWTDDGKPSQPVARAVRDYE